MNQGVPGPVRVCVVEDSANEPGRTRTNKGKNTERSPGLSQDYVACSEVTERVLVSEDKLVGLGAVEQVWGSHGKMKRFAT